MHGLPALNLQHQPLMYPEDLKHQTGNNSPGVGARFYLAALPWFDTMASPVSAGVMGDSVIITTPHTFLELPTPSPAPSPMPSPIPKYGFIEVYTTSGSGKASIKQVGSPDNYGIESTFEAHVPGSMAAWFEIMSQNNEYVLLLQEPDCAAQTYKQYGTKCDPCYADGIEWASGAKGSTDKRGFTVKFKAYGAIPLLYTAAVPRVGSWT